MLGGYAVRGGYVCALVLGGYAVRVGMCVHLCWKGICFKGGYVYAHVLGGYAVRVCTCVAHGKSVHTKDFKKFKGRFTHGRDEP